MSTDGKVLVIDACTCLKRVAEGIEESNGDKNRVLPVYETRLRHNELTHVAPELWVLFHCVMARRALSVYARELLIYINRPVVPIDDFYRKRQVEIIAKIRRIITEDLSQPESETVKTLSAYEQTVLSVPSEVKS